MNKEEQSYFRFTLAVAIILVTVVSFATVMLYKPEPTESKPTTSARVVDTYEGCDIVEWHYSPLAEYRYFLHCEK
jgi:hypothetical protein